MKLKNIIIFLAVMFLFIGVVSASNYADNTTDTIKLEHNMQDTQTDIIDDVDEYNQDNKNSKSIIKEEDKNIKQTPETNYEELKSQIAAANNNTTNTTIKLKDDGYDVTETITINNSHITITIDGNGQTVNGWAMKFLNITHGSSVILKNITISYCNSQTGGAIYNAGNLTIINSGFNNNTATGFGGAIYNAGNLTILNSGLNNNTATDDGGTIYNAGNLIINDTSINNGTAKGYAGAIYNYYGSLTLIKTTFDNNVANKYGGAIHNERGKVTITNSNITNNKVDRGYDGGAINNDIGNLTIINSTISYNRAEHSFNGGAIKNIHGNVTINNCLMDSNYAGRYGGAVYSELGTLNISDSRIIGNNATVGGGAVACSQTRTNINNSRFYNNIAGEGGAILTTEALLNINNSNVSFNMARIGSAISVHYGNLTINNASIIYNEANLTGAIYNYRQSATINNSYISQNKAANGSAVYNDDGILIINNSEFNFNNATEKGGAIYNHKDVNNTSCTVDNSSFNRNIAGSAAAIYSDHSDINNTITNNTFIKNDANDHETLILNGENILNNNIYNDTEISIQLKLSTKDNQSTFNYGDDVIILFEIKIDHPKYYDSNVASQLERRIYSDGTEYAITTDDYYVLPHYNSGNHSVYYVNQAFKSNIVEYIVNVSQITINDSYDYYEGINNSIILSIIDGESNGTLEISVKENDTYKKIITYYDVRNGHVIALQTLKDALENLYHDLDDSYTIQLSYENEIVTKGYKQFTLNIIKQRNTSIIADIINNHPQDVKINITVIDSIYNTPLNDANITIIGAINTSCPQGIITDNTLSEGNYTITVNFNQTDKYNPSNTTINFTVLNKNMTIEELEEIIKNLTEQLEQANNTIQELNKTINKANSIITYEIINNTPANIQINITVIDQTTNTPIQDAPIQITGDITQNTTAGIISDETLTPGNYTINVQYPETENYKASNTTIKFQIQKYNQSINIDTRNTIKGDKTSITINTNNTLSDGKLEVFIEDTLVATITEFGQNTITITDIDTTNYKIGENKVIVKYTDSQIYNDMTIEALLTVLKRDVSISAGDINIPLDVKTTNLTVTFNETVNDGTIEVLLNKNIIGSYNITKNTTLADVEIYNTNIAKSPSNITVKYTGSSLYNDAAINTTITTNKPQTNMTIDPVTPTANHTVNLTAKITTDSNIPINEGKVVFKVNDKTVKDANGKVIYAKVDGGIAQAEYSIPENLAGQNITITATYTGTTIYNQETTNITALVTNKTDTIPTLTLTPITGNVQTASNVTLKAKVSTGDNPITTGKIVFKINGKTIKDENGKVIYAKVDSNGEVSVNYNIGNLKAGNYTIEATFIASGYDKLTDNTAMIVMKV